MHAFLHALARACLHEGRVTLLEGCYPGRRFAPCLLSFRVSFTFFFFNLFAHIYIINYKIFTFFFKLIIWLGAYQKPGQAFI